MMDIEQRETLKLLHDMGFSNRECLLLMYQMEQGKDIGEAYVSIQRGEDCEPCKTE